MVRWLNVCLLLLLTSCLDIDSSSQGRINQRPKDKQAFERKVYYCEYCGKQFSDARDLSINSCKKHPKGVYKGSHKQYRGGKKDRYECRYCGKSARTISDLVSSTCSHSKKKGWHRPR